MLTFCVRMPVDLIRHPEKDSSDKQVAPLLWPATTRGVLFKGGLIVLRFKVARKRMANPQSIEFPPNSERHSEGYCSKAAEWRANNKDSGFMKLGSGPINFLADWRIA
jgi:hypothetical protein